MRHRCRQLFLKLCRHRLLLCRSDHSLRYIVNLGVGVLRHPDQNLPRVLVGAGKGGHQRAARHVNDWPSLQRLLELLGLLQQLFGLPTNRQPAIITDAISGHALARRTVHGAFTAVTPRPGALVRSHG